MLQLISVYRRGSENALTDVQGLSIAAAPAFLFIKRLLEIR
jgi:hypothetical protein